MQTTDPKTQAADPVRAAIRVFDSLTKGRGADKYEALKVLDKGDPAINRDYLRDRISGALAGEFERDGDLQEQEDEVTRTRRWLLSALGRLTDPEGAAEFVEENILPDKELDEDDRFWALEGLIASGVSGLEERVREIEGQERKKTQAHRPLVRALAVAYLASQRDDEKKEEIQEWLKKDSGDLQRQWAALMALKNVPIKATVYELCELIGTADKDDSRNLTVYRAIRALGVLGPTLGPQAKEKATTTLMVFVRRWRDWPVWDEARARALAALGDLGSENAVTTLVEELTGDNPSVAREAARALRDVAGVRTATARIVEATCGLDHKHPGALLVTGSSYAKPFANALRWMEEDYASIVEELEAVMVSGPLGQQEAARALLSEIGGAAAIQKLQARKDAMEAYTSAMEDAEKRIQNLFETSINEARSGFGVAVLMDVVVFLLGVGLLISSAVLAMVQGNLDGWAGVATGGAGILGILYGTLVAKPREQVREAIDHLMYLKVVFLAYLRQLHQADQAYTRQLVEDEEGITPEDLDRFSGLVERSMKNAVLQLNGNATPPPEHQASGSA